jgi:tetratricopeptide (TPR) repeat protein
MRGPTFLRRLMLPPWVRGVVRNLFIPGLGGSALYMQFSYRVPGNWFFLLPWLNLALIALGLLFLVNHLVRASATDTRLSRYLERTEYWGSLAILGFCFYSLALIINGSHDRSLPEGHRSQVLGIARADAGLLLGNLPSVSWVTLRSWREPNGVERLLLSGRERDRLWVGQAVVVNEHSGLLGIPWVSSVGRDAEKYARDALTLAPTAARAWKELILFYLDQRRWGDVVIATQEYLRLYPADYAFLRGIAWRLNSSERHREVATLLEPVVARREDFDLNLSLAGSLGSMAPSEKAIALAKRAIAMEPENFKGYFTLAQIYAEWGNLEDSITMYEKTLEFLPSFSFAERERDRLRRILAQREAWRARTGQPTRPPGK